MRVLGIDEAGRGCVLGDLFLAGYLVDGVSAETLFAAGARDSKRLSPKRRLEARERLALLGAADVRRITPQAIDDGNLNALEEDAIVALVLQYRPDVVIVDALGHPRTLPATIERLNARAPATWVMEPKADDTYAEVGAASIFAKTARDEALAAFDATHGPLGSGYPSDPVTRRWLAAWHATAAAWPPFVRTRWGTIRDLGER